MKRVLLRVFVILLFLILSSSVPAAATANRDHPPGAPSEPSVASAPRLAGWYPIYRAPGQAWYLQVDGARARTLVAAWFNNGSYNPNSSGWYISWNVLVLDMSGNLLHNISVSRDSGPWFAGLALDSSNGQAYVSLYNGTVVHIDPGSGRILHWWTYWTGLRTIVAQGGDVWVALCCNAGTVMRISGATGALLRNYTIAGQGEAISIAVDPAGRWFFVALSGPLVGDLYRVDMTTGATAWFGPGNTVLLSADGKRIWLCGWYPLAWYWLGNNTSGSSSVACADRIAENPVTGVLALANSGRFIDVSGDVGTFHFQDNVEGYPWQATDVGWTSDGGSLVALAWSLSEVYVGLWDGDPWLNATEGRLTNPNFDLICYPLVSAGGLNISSIIEYRDGIVIARGTPGMTQACFGNVNPSVPLMDGDHVGRIVGFDRVGRALNGTVTFSTDGTPPLITIESPDHTDTVPYTVFGTADDPHLVRVFVWPNVTATLAGHNWSAPVTLWIGNNTIGVVATDALGNGASVTASVRYWPAFRNNVSDPQGQFHISIPPEWTRATGFVERGQTVGAAVFAPREGTYVYNTSAKVWTEPHPGIQETQAAAFALAVDGAKRVIGGMSRCGIQNLTVDGHPAAQFCGYVGGNVIGPNTTLAILRQTYVVSAASGRAYVIAFNVSWMQLQYEGTQDWILASFHIDTSSSIGFASPGVVLVIGVLVASAGIGGLVVTLWILRRRSMKPPIPPQQR